MLLSHAIFKTFTDMSTQKKMFIRLDLYKSKTHLIWIPSLARKQSISKIINLNPQLFYSLSLCAKTLQKNMDPSPFYTFMNKLSGRLSSLDMVRQLVIEKEHCI